ncbi:MAG: riboflavin synthase [Methylocella sp.]
MFTGLVSNVGEVERVDTGAKLNHLRIACSYAVETIVPGASIACGGACLTVVAGGESGDRSWFEADVAAETLARTTARHWAPGTRLNLERPLRLGDELGGHIVTGHVDAVAEIVAIADFDGMRRIGVKAPHGLARFIAEKGSVALDGTSLTVNRVEADIFSVLLIPHTLRMTTWGERRLSDEINLEVDLMARYAARLAETLSQKP